MFHFLKTSDESISCNYLHKVIALSPFNFHVTTQPSRVRCVCVCGCGYHSLLVVWSQEKITLFHEYIFKMVTEVAIVKVRNTRPPLATQLVSITCHLMYEEWMNATAWTTASPSSSLLLLCSLLASRLSSSLLVSIQVTWVICAHSFRLPLLILHLLESAVCMLE